jgi:hypothetical protein
LVSATQPSLQLSFINQFGLRGVFAINVYCTPSTAAKKSEHFEPQFELILLQAAGFKNFHNNNKNLNADNKTASINKEISMWFESGR